MDTLNLDTTGLDILAAGIAPFVGMTAGPVACYLGLMLLAGVVAGNLAAVAGATNNDLSDRVPNMF